jgi:hypothetical protein
MKYAKVKDSTLLKYPYTWDDLLVENPYTKFDDRYELADWYNKTNDCLLDGNELVEVIAEDGFDVDHRTQNYTVSQSPVKKNGVWVLELIVTEKTEDEIHEYDEFMKTVPSYTRNA